MGKAPQRGSLSEAELDVLKVLWDQGSGTVRQVNERLARRGRQWAYTTVLTLLQRLQSKGWAESDACGPAHVYHATGTREDWLDMQLQLLADRACEGDSAPLVLALVHKGRFTPEELAGFRKLINQLETEQRRKIRE